MNILCRKIIFSFMVGVGSFLVVYFILNKSLPHQDFKKIVLTYKTLSNERVKVYTKNKGEVQICNSILIDSLKDGVYQETFQVPQITPNHKLDIVLEKDSNALIYSVQFQYNRFSKTWNNKDVLTNFKNKENLTIQYKGLSRPLVLETKESIANITQKFVFIRLSLYSLVFSALTMIVFFIFIANDCKRIPLKEMLLVFLFLSIIYTPLLIDYQSLSDYEKRGLVQKPQFKITKLLNNLKDYGQYFSDHFGFRSSLIKMNNELKFRLFHVSPFPQKVIIGKDNWLFHSEGNCLDIIQNRNLYTTAELKKIKANLEKKREWLNKMNIKLYVFVPPLKARIYPEYLPDYYNKINAQSKLDQLKEYLLKYSDIHIIDPTTQLIKGKETYNTYYSNDTHWTLYGGLIGYNVLLKEIKKDFPQINLLNLKDFNFEKVEKEGNLGKMINIEHFVISEEYKPVYKDPNVLSYKLSNPGIKDNDFLQPARLIESNDTSGLKVVFFRDSFSDFYLLYNGYNFSRGLFLWTHVFKPEIIKIVKPDIVVDEIYGEYLDDLLNENVELGND